jgi:hypothetical protein
VDLCLVYLVLVVEMVAVHPLVGVQMVEVYGRHHHLFLDLSFVHLAVVV